MSIVRLSIAAAALAVGLSWSQPVHAQQWLEVNVGRHMLRGLDSRVPGDVLLVNRGEFVFNLDDFTGPTFGGEWQVGLGRYFEVGAGLDYIGGSAQSRHRYLAEPDGSDIEQEFRFRVTPLAVILRVMPFGAPAAVQPYFGGGIGMYNWRYSEEGRFVADDLMVVSDRSVSTGNAAGAVILGGIRFPLGSRLAAGVEVRYHQATADLDPEQLFLSDRIDLGGLATRFTFRVGF